MNKRALIILHSGFEEIEAITPIDLLSRAQGEVVQASVHGEFHLTGRSGITLAATYALQDVAEEVFDIIILPGGPGIMELRGDETLSQLLTQQIAAGRKVACICAAPLILLDAGLLAPGLHYTAHPSTLNELPDAAKEAVVIDQNIITSSGAGTATEFGLTLVSLLAGKEVAKEIAASISWRHVF